jgi:hypothetical protein
VPAVAAALLVLGAFGLLAAAGLYTPLIFSFAASAADLLMNAQLLRGGSRLLVASPAAAAAAADPPPVTL